MHETSASAIAVLRTRLPYVDRRSLSEAWFSALHLAAGDSASTSRRVGIASPRRDATVPRGPAGGGVTSAPVPATSGRYRGVVRAWTAARPASAGDEPSAATRCATPAVRRAAVVPRALPVRHTSLTVGVEGSRVQLVVRREGNVLHVIALCRADLAPVVCRALAGADAHLRLRGEGVRASVRTFAAGAGA